MYPTEQAPPESVQVVELKVLEVDPIHHRIVLAAIGFPDEPLKVIPKPPIDTDSGATESPADAAAAPPPAGAGEAPQA